MGAALAVVFLGAAALALVALGFAAAAAAGFLVEAFFASADSLYEFLTLIRTPLSTPFLRAAFMICFLIVVYDVHQMDEK